jgi:hypothetical protein
MYFYVKTTILHHYILSSIFTGEKEDSMPIDVSFILGEMEMEIGVAVSGLPPRKHLGLKLWALCTPPLVPPVISRVTPRQAT